MARARTIKPAFFTSEQLASCSPTARLLFVGLWCIADRAGKLRDRPRKIKAELMPYETVEDADAWLEELSRAGLVQRYAGPDGQRFLKVNGFERHQNPHPKEPPSEIPEPCFSAAEPCFSTTSSGNSGTSRAFNPSPHSPFPIPSSSPASDPIIEGGRASMVEMGDIGAQTIARVCEGIGHGLAPLQAQDEADEFERRLVAVGGVDVAVAYFAATIRERDTDPKAVKLLLLLLRDRQGRDF